MPESRHQKGAGAHTDAQGQPLPAHVTQPLLALVTQQALDQDYAQAARRRADSTAPEPGRRGASGAVLAVLALFGLLVGTAAAQTTRNAAVDQSSRATLVARIGDGRDALAAVQDRIGRLQARNQELEQELDDVRAEESAAVAQTQRLRTRTGFGPTTGPGVRAVVTDSPSGLSSEAVRDTDLALLVDALWGVGAEAVAVNGQRLTPLSGIRNVGAAVHVNGVPLSPPYVVQAVGDPRTLQAALVDSARGQQFLTLVDTYGFGFDMTNQDSIALPGAPLRALRFATLVSGMDNEPVRPTSSAGDEGGGAP